VPFRTGLNNFARLRRAKLASGTARGGSGEQIARDGQRQIGEAFMSFGVSAALTDGKGRSVMESPNSLWLRELLTHGSGGR